MTDLSRRSFLLGAATVAAATAIPVAALTNSPVACAAEPVKPTVSTRWIEVDPVHGVDGPLRTGPFRTLAAAADEADRGGGGTIYLRPGVYEHAAPIFVNHSTNFVGASDGRAIIRTLSKRSDRYAWPASIPQFRPAPCASSTIALAYYV